MNQQFPAGWWRELPDGKRISPLGFGCSSLWAKPDFPEDLADEILRTLAEGGVNCFDTAPLYGAGTGERRLARFLKGQDPAQFVISTKVGHNLIDGRIIRSFDPEVMERSLRQSLDRLGLARVDLLFLHGPSLDNLDRSVIDWLEAKKQAGLIGWSGVNSFDNAVLESVANLPIDAVMLQYSAADFRNSRAMDRLIDAGKLVFSGTALGRASFDLKRFLPVDRARMWYLLRMLRHNPSALLKAGRLRRALREFDPDPYAAALRFMASHPHVLTSLFGTSSLDHAKANLANARKPIERDKWTVMKRRLEALGVTDA